MVVLTVTVASMLRGTRVLGFLVSSPEHALSVQNLQSRSGTRLTHVYNSINTCHIFKLIYSRPQAQNLSHSPTVGKATTSVPIPHATRGFVQPLTSWVRVLKTNAEEPRWPKPAKTPIVAIRNMTWQIPPIISRALAILLNQKFQTTGTTTKAHMIRVVCHALGSYDGLFNLIRPITGLAR